LKSFDKKGAHHFVTLPKVALKAKNKNKNNH